MEWAQFEAWNNDNESQRWHFYDLLGLPQECREVILEQLGGVYAGTGGDEVVVVLCVVLFFVGGGCGGEGGVGGGLLGGGGGGGFPNQVAGLLAQNILIPSSL